MEAKDFLVQRGRFEILVGASSEDIRLKAAIEVTSTAIVKKHFYRNSTFASVSRQTAVIRDFGFQDWIRRRNIRYRVLREAFMATN